MSFVRILAALAAAALTLALAIVGVLVYPQPFFAYHAARGRLELYDDRPFDVAASQRLLAEIETRLETSSLDDHKSHAIIIANAPWREALVFNIARGAAGVNFYPLTNNIFIRRADIVRDEVFGRSGKPAAPPRTLAYYAAHEIAHSFTAERLGLAHGWNRALPQWIREGYADYVGMGGRVDVDDLYRRYRAGDPDLDYRRSGVYAKFRLLTAYMLDRRGWSVDHLLASGLSEQSAEKMMNAGMSARAAASPP